MSVIFLCPIHPAWKSMDKKKSAFITNKDLTLWLGGMAIFFFFHLNQFWLLLKEKAAKIIRNSIYFFIFPLFWDFKWFLHLFFVHWASNFIKIFFSATYKWEPCLQRYSALLIPQLPSTGLPSWHTKTQCQINSTLVFLWKNSIFLSFVWKLITQGVGKVAKVGTETMLCKIAILCLQPCC